MATLAEIRAKLISQQAKIENKTGDNALFPHWNAPEGQSSTIRLLPDADPENVYFWVERLHIRLPFQGVKNDHDREVSVNVPCMEMYGESCPILAETRPWWKDASLEDLARRYWKKKSYFFNGFVVSSAVEEKELPENPIRRFQINKGIFEIIKSSLMNPEMEDLPIDYTNGRDFTIKKTMQGGFPNYGTSNWSFKTRSLSVDEQDAIKKYGLFTLKDFLPKKPNAEELGIIKDMFQASVNDEAYDLEKWGNYFKPFGVNNDGPGGVTKPNVVVQMQKPNVNAFSKNFIKQDDDEIIESVSNAAPSTLASEVEASEASGVDVMAKLQARSTNTTKAEKPASKTDTMELLRRIKDKQGMAQ